VVSPGDEAREALVRTGAQAYMPIVGDEVYAGGGFPLIYDCVGSEQTIKQALRYATVRGRIVLLGCAAQIPKLDLTFVWANELEVKGYQCYGDERWRGDTRHTFEITHDMLLEMGTPVERMVTHVYPLSQYRDALSTAANRRKSGSVKVLLDPRAG
jgi:threonine dehydrogenase-like Zn-dependent dehydrogenase